MLLGFVIVIVVAIGLNRKHRLFGDVIDNEEIEVGAEMSDVLTFILIKQRPVANYIAERSVAQDAQVSELRVFSENVFKQGLCEVFGVIFRHILVPCEEIHSLGRILAI